MKSEFVVQLARAALEGRPEAVQQTLAQISEDESAKGNDRLAQEFKLLARTKSLGRPIQPAPSFPESYRASQPKGGWRNAGEIQEWALEVPHDRLSELVLPESMIGQIQRAVNDLLNEDRLRDWGVKEATRVLLHGPPGTGKTVAARAIAGEARRPVIVVQLDQVMSSYLGETAKNVGAAFERAIHEGAIIFLDEIDALAKSRDDGQDVGELKRTVNSILQILDRTKDLVPVIAATNHAQILDAAIWRRFSDIIAFERPDAAARESILARLLAQVPANVKQWTAPNLALLTEGFTGSDLRRLVMNATRAALHSGSNSVGDEHVLSALHESVRMVHGQTITVERLREIGEVTALSQKGHTYREIMKEMGYASTSKVFQILNALKKGRFPDAHGVQSHRDSANRPVGG
jgi:SpoVK/Ycf46/Vps4 family AAA+-type ATPase